MEKKKGRGSRHRNRRPRPISATIITGRDTVCLPPVMKGAHRRTGDGLNFLAKERRHDLQPALVVVIPGCLASLIAIARSARPMFQ